MEGNPELAEQILGIPPVLDDAQSWVLARFWDLRNGTPADRGIPVGDDDPLIDQTLRALDQCYRADRAQQIEAIRDEIASKSRR